MRRKSGKLHLLHFAMFRKASGEGLRIVAHAIEAHLQRLQTAMNQPGLERSRYGPGKFSPIAHGGDEAGVTRSDVAENHVGMAVDRFCIRRNHGIGAEFDGALPKGRRRRVVHDHSRSGLAALGGCLANIADVEPRIRRRLDPHQPKSGEILAVEVRRWARLYGDAIGCEVAVSQSTRGVIGVRGQKDAIARLGQAAKDRRLRRHPGRKNNGLGVFQNRKRVFERAPGGVAPARILIWPRRVAGKEENTRGHDGGHDGIVRATGSVDAGPRGSIFL